MGPCTYRRHRDWPSLRDITGQASGDQPDLLLQGEVVQVMQRDNGSPGDGTGRQQHRTDHHCRKSPSEPGGERPFGAGIPRF